MAYVGYNFSDSETIEDVAKTCNISVDTLMRINNVLPPYPNSLSEMPQFAEGMILVPQIFSGGEQFEDYNRMYYGVERKSEKRQVLITPIVSSVGFASQGCCSISVQGVGAASFPCFPESYSDSHTASVGSLTPLGRSEPFRIYQNSGPRTVSVSFRMHREMTRSSDVGAIVGLVQSATYPIGGYPIIPKTTLVIGNNCAITGIVENVSTNWSDTIIDNQYQIVTLDFSVSECTGSPKMAPAVAARCGR